jgi:phenylalanyl-tRNA synthetase beta chain
MKTSMKWLSHYVDLPGDCREVAERLTLAGLEVEGIEQVGAMPDGVMVGKILSRNPHPDAERLSVCEVDAGTGETLQIVCGAPNCDAGNKVPVATVGTVMGENFKIKKAKLRGVASFGMLCSRDELGLGGEHTGLFELPADAPVGTPLGDYLESDAVIDWEVTPNRPDWLSHLGIAREMAAVCDCRDSFKFPEVTLTPVAGTDVADLASVEVQAPELCPRYTARVIRNVKIGSSPEWLQQALEAVGLRSINNVVDITNFVLMECGQPLHAFDYDLVAGHKIVVRRAAAGETLKTLDGAEHKLSAENLVIADAEKGVALAGIMGGGNSEISETTTTVLLESAAFDASNIRASSKQLGVRSDSSHRFERGVGLDMVDFAGRRAAALLCELAGGELVDGVIDVYPQPYVAHTVTARFARINQLIGVEIAPEMVADFFERLGLTVVQRDADAITVSIPSFRLDLEREADLIEEVVRLYGLDNIPAAPATAKLGGSMKDDAFYPVEKARAELLGLGLDESITYTLMSQSVALNGTGLAENELFELSNPISAENAILRPSLIPGLVQVLAHNVAHHNHDLRLFEIGRVFNAGEKGLPEERLQAGLLLCGRPHPERFGAERGQLYDFYDMKGLLTSWLDARGLSGAVCRVASHPGFVAGQCAEIVVGKRVVAVFGKLAPALVKGMRLKSDAFVALVELDSLLSLASGAGTYEALPQFPATSRDISLVAPLEVTNEQILATIRQMNPKFLESIELTDIFEDAKVLGPGKRGLTYSLTYRHTAKTLKDEEANNSHARVRKRLAQQLPVEYR